MLTLFDIAERAAGAWACVAAVALLAVGISLHLDRRARRRDQRKDNES